MIGGGKGMQYNLTAIEILQHLGFDAPLGRQTLETLKKKYDIPLPKVYRTFMEKAIDCPVLGTSDLWTCQRFSLPMELKRLYEHLSEGDKVSNHDSLKIDSDYGEDSVRIEDLRQDAPPLYMQREAKWCKAYEKLSDFLQRSGCQCFGPGELCDFRRSAGGIWLGIHRLHGGLLGKV